jgi:hypothetical protein
MVEEKGDVAAAVAGTEEEGLGSAMGGRLSLCSDTK